MQRLIEQPVGDGDLFEEGGRLGRVLIRGSVLHYLCRHARLRRFGRARLKGVEEPRPVFKSGHGVDRVISVEPIPSSLPVTRELNYLYEPGQPQHMFSGGKDLDALVVKIVRRMMKSAPKAVHTQYVETFHALSCDELASVLGRPI